MGCDSSSGNIIETRFPSEPIFIGTANTDGASDTKRSVAIDASVMLEVTRGSLGENDEHDVIDCSAEGVSDATNVGE
jgi:hypothetical protein